MMKIKDFLLKVTSVAFGAAVVMVAALLGTEAETVWAEQYPNAPLDEATAVDFGESFAINDDWEDDWFKFTVPQRGIVTIEIQRERLASGGFNIADFWLLNEEAEFLMVECIGGNDKTISMKMGLDQGNYYLGIDCYYNDKMSYSVKFEATDLYEVEKNNVASQATKLTLGKECLANTYATSDTSDWYDYYSIDLIKDRVYRVIIENAIELSNYSSFNIADSTNVWSDILWDAKVYGEKSSGDLYCDIEATETGAFDLWLQSDMYICDEAIEYGIKVIDVTCEVKGHKYFSEVTKQPSYTSTGNKKYTCSICDYTKDETIPATVGLNKNTDGSWYYYSGGKHDTFYTGLCKHNGKWFYVKKGVLDWSYTGLCKYNGSWFYVKSGILDWSYTGLCKYNGSWFYVKEGKVNWNYTGLCKHKGSWFYVKGGILDWSYTGLCKYGSNWYHVEKGVVNWKYTGLSRYNGNWFYVNKGVVNWKYTGLCKYSGNWYYINQGKLDWNYTGMCKYGTTWYYIMDGVIYWDYTGLCKYNGNCYYVKGGVLDWNYTGLCKYGFNSWYYIKGGIWKSNYTGLCKYASTWYYISNGILDTYYEGVCRYGSKYYVIENGRIAWDYTGSIYYGGSYWYAQNGVLHHRLDYVY